MGAHRRLALSASSLTQDFLRAAARQHQPCHQLCVLLRPTCLAADAWTPAQNAGAGNISTGFASQAAYAVRAASAP